MEEEENEESEERENMAQLRTSSPCLQLPVEVSRDRSEIEYLRRLQKEALLGLELETRRQAVRV